MLVDIADIEHDESCRYGIDSDRYARCELKVGESRWAPWSDAVATAAI